MAFPFRIKVCGITTEDAARTALEAGADYLGLVLCPSPRRLTLDRARALAASAPAAGWVGVFADSPLDEIRDAARVLGLSAVQLHGNETVAQCRLVSRVTGLPVWKAVRADREIASAYEGAVGSLLLDAGAGGTGRTLDWEAIGARFPRARRIVPMLLAGGLGPDNVAEAIAAARPDGVDASSRLESTPGVKDTERVRAFVRAARKAAEAGHPVEASR